MKKAGLLYVIILFLFIFSVNIISSQESIDVDLQQRVDLNEEFDLSLGLVGFDEGVYDIKFEIMNGSRNIAQRFYENEWRSTNYWLYGAIDETNSLSGTFRLKIIEEYDGPLEIIIKIKSGTIREFDGYIVYVDDEQLNNEEPDNESEILDLSDEDETSSYFDIDWTDDEIINGNEFEIEIEGTDLGDRPYNIKVWIEKDEENVIISERYDEENDEWLSGTYYVKDLIEGPGDENEMLLLRIKESYRDYVGDAKIFIRSNDQTIDTEEYDIEILAQEKEEQAITTKSVSNSNSDIKDTSKMTENEYLAYIMQMAKEYDEKNEIESRSITGNVIKLGNTDKILKTENIKRQGTSVYESGESIIKKYAIISFALFSVILTVLLIFNKLK